MEFIQNLPNYIEPTAQVLMAIVVIATAVANMLPKDKAAKIEGFTGKILKVLSYLPTLGINPRTKALETQLQEMKDAAPDRTRSKSDSKDAVSASKAA